MEASINKHLKLDIDAFESMLATPTSAVPAAAIPKNVEEAEPLGGSPTPIIISSSPTGSDERQEEAPESSQKASCGATVDTALPMYESAPSGALVVVPTAVVDRPVAELRGKALASEEIHQEVETNTPVPAGKESVTPPPPTPKSLEEGGTAGADAPSASRSGTGPEPSGSRPIVSVDAPFWWEDVTNLMGRIRALRGAESYSSLSTMDIICCHDRHLLHVSVSADFPPL